MSDKVKVEERKQSIRQALLEGVSYQKILSVTKMPPSTLNWYIQKIRTEDHEIMRNNHVDLLGQQIVQMIQRLDMEIEKTVEIERSEEALPKDRLEAIKTRIDIYILQVRVLNSGLVNNLDDKSKLDQRLGESPVQRREGKGNKPGDTKQTKSLVLRESNTDNKPGKSGDKLLSKSPGRPRKTPRHHERIGDDAVSDSTTDTSKQEEGD